MGSLENKSHELVIYITQGPSFIFGEEYKTQATGLVLARVDTGISGYNPFPAGGNNSRGLRTSTEKCVAFTLMSTNG